MARRKDIYDDMPDGAAQRRRNRQRLAELERQETLRRARIAEVINFDDLAGRMVLPACPHVL
jgi:hypothetical protein